MLVGSPGMNGGGAGSIAEAGVGRRHAGVNREPAMLSGSVARLGGRYFRDGDRHSGRGRGLRADRQGHQGGGKGGSGEATPGRQEFRNLVTALRENSRQIGEGLVMRTNGVAAHTVLEGRLLRHLVHEAAAAKLAKCIASAPSKTPGRPGMEPGSRWRPRCRSSR